VNANCTTFLSAPQVNKFFSFPSFFLFFSFFPLFRFPFFFSSPCYLRPPTACLLPFPQLPTSIHPLGRGNKEYDADGNLVGAAGASSAASGTSAGTIAIAVVVGVAAVALLVGAVVVVRKRRTTNAEARV
jgi:hypothetical protein